MTIITLAMLTILSSTSVVHVGAYNPAPEDYITLLSWLADEFRPDTAVPVIFGTDLDLAGHTSGLVLPLDVKLKQLQGIDQLGVGVVRLTIAYDPWLLSRSLNPETKKWANEKIHEVDELVSAIRAKGRKLMIADAAAEAYWKKPLTWEEFRNAFLERVTNLTERYHPEYYIIIKEPAWYISFQWLGSAGMISEVTEPDMWLKLAEELTKLTKALSPSTLTATASGNR